MGLLDKLFGGKKPDANQPQAAPSSAPAVPAASNGDSSTSGHAVARRERTKREQVADQAEGALQQMIGDSPLLQAINAVVANDNPGTRTQVYVEMLRTELYLVLMNDSDDVPGGEVTLTQGQQVALATITAPDGNGVFLPAFTDAERLQRALPPEGKARYVRLQSQAIFQMFLQGPGQGIVINPGQPPSGMITRGEAEVLATGAVPQFDENGQLQATADQQVKVMLARPQEPPPAEFVAAIREATSQQPLVREAHVFLAAIGPQPAKLMVGLLLDEAITEEELHAVFGTVGKHIHENRGEVETFDMLPLQDQMLDAVKQLDGLIYRR